MTPRLSVVVPFYGVGEYLGDCLESIAEQAWTDFEAILVDDGSPDDSAVVAKQFCARDPRFRLIQQDNAGPFNPVGHVCSERACSHGRGRSARAG